MKRGMIVAIAAGGVVLILLWYFFLFSPTSNDLNDTRQQVSEAQRQKQQLENTVRHLKELSNNRIQQQADLLALRKAVPEQPDLGEFILQANDIATASGVDWLAISPSPPVASTQGPKSTIALSMQIDGGFFQVLDYLNRLEDLDRLVIVDSVSISAGGAGSGSGTGSTGASSSSGSSSAAGSSNPSDPTLSVTLTGRMFTNAAAAPIAGSTGGTTSGGTTTPTTPTTSTSSSSSSGGNS